MSSIVETIIFIGRQKIAPRGHRDAGRTLLEPPLENGGNFRSLLLFRMASGDQVLMEHIRSPKIQNELIKICGGIILDIGFFEHSQVTGRF